MEVFVTAVQTWRDEQHAEVAHPDSVRLKVPMRLSKIHVSVDGFRADPILRDTVT